MRTRRTFPWDGPITVTDALLVNYINADTVDGNSDNVIQVKVAKVGQHRDKAPARAAISDAEHLLDQCGEL